MTESNGSRKQPPSIRWWPGLVLAILATVAILWARSQTDWAFQKRNLTTAQIGLVTAILLLVWWTFASRAPDRLRLRITFGLAGAALICATLFRLRGMTGDMSPIIEFRWANHQKPAAPPQTAEVAAEPVQFKQDFPQFGGPDRNGILSGPRLDTNWTLHPPQVRWRQKVGAGWSGFALVGQVAITQEQRDANECVVAYELGGSKQIWMHPTLTRYKTTIAGEGPRATPTVVSNRVFVMGATGVLKCLELATGKLLWARDVVAESKAKVLQWGCTSSPLVVGELVVVHGGEGIGRSLFAYHLMDGKPAWVAGASDASYASPSLVTLADEPQVLAFNDGTISGHHAVTGVTLWERAWGNGNVVCASPVVVSTNQVLFSSGYGVGAELLEISRTPTGKFSVQPVWKSIRMKAKFAHLFARAGFLYGLDDGQFACVDLRDGALRWKEGRYGHGQGLLVDELYLLMAESGELVLLRPTSTAPNEIVRFRVFDSKTWNPSALSGDLLVVRNDQEAVCLKLKLAP